MIISRNWLKQYVDIKVSDEELIELIASRLGEVESWKQIGPMYEGVVVADIIEAKDHPDADKLGVYQIDNGSNKLQVVAGDKSLKKGDKVAHIPVGNIVPATANSDEPLTLEKRDLRGEESNGMLASAAELDFGDDHEGVLALDTDAKAGTALSEVYELDDLIIEIENKALTHRPDCFGFIGIAREVAGIQGVAFTSPDWFSNVAEKVNSSDELKVEVDNKIPKKVRRVTLKAYKDVEIKKSPIIMQSYLARVGLRPINNIVDITNYLMVASGQPLHAFDYDKVAEKSSGDGAKVVIRDAEKNEKLTLLDGKELKLKGDEMLIATDQEGLSLAGIMGGSDSEVTESTKNVLMEVANFDLYNIRNTSMRYGLFTDAATRFARGQDPEQCAAAQNEAMSLLIKYANATPASPLIDEYPGKKDSKVVTANTGRINDLLGTNYSSADMAKTLGNVEFNVSQNGDELNVTPPAWRNDIEIWEDVAEEIGRLKGYNNIEVTLPTRSVSSAKQYKLNSVNAKIRSVLSSMGANEVLSYNFVSADQFTMANMDSKEAYELINAISPKLHFLRTAISPGVLEKIYPNIRKNYHHFSLFELGKSHSKSEIDKDKLPTERRSVAVVVTAEDKWAAQNVQGSAYFSAKAMLMQLLMELNVPDVKVENLTSNEWWIKNTANIFNENRVAQVLSGERVIGLVGEYRSSVKNSFKLPTYSAGFELDVEKLVELSSVKPNYEPISKFPPVAMDVTFSTPDDVTHDLLRSSFSQALDNKKDLIKISTASIYRAEDQKDTRNISFNVLVVPQDKTRTSEEVNQLVSKAVEKVNTELSTSQV